MSSEWVSVLCSGHLNMQRWRVWGGDGALEVCSICNLKVAAVPALEKASHSRGIVPTRSFLSSF